MSEPTWMPIPANRRLILSVAGASCMFILFLIQLLTCTFSPEDHAILEAEYQRNPKPDKAARASIVNRVALGEKEVQVRVELSVTISSLPFG